VRLGGFGRKGGPIACWVRGKDRVGKVACPRENGITFSKKILQVNNVPTFSDTKRSFYSLHTRPINSIYRRVVEELMVEMHLLWVNVDFRYDPIYALGVVSSFDQFMQGYTPPDDRVSIFNSLCKALGDDPQRYQEDAQRLQGVATGSNGPAILAGLTLSDTAPGAEQLREMAQAIASNPKFKYSRLFAIGLFNLLQMANPEMVKDEKQLASALKQVCDTLNLPEDQLQKDLELYRSNLEKMNQARSVMADILQADRKKQAQRLKEKNASNSQGDSTEEGQASDTPQE